MAKQIEVTRTFDAPVEMVWEVWGDPELDMGTMSNFAQIGLEQSLDKMTAIFS
jgi:hypothetical protein